MKTLVLFKEDILDRFKEKTISLLNISDFRITAKQEEENDFIMYVSGSGTEFLVLKNKNGKCVYAESVDITNEINHRVHLIERAVDILFSNFKYDTGYDIDEVETYPYISSDLSNTLTTRIRLKIKDN